jgi:endogenous inhibitor of DNA gyrase (YacG/DUF329 family)
MDYQMTVPAPDAAPAAEEMRVCPNCAARFAAGGRGLGKTFCSKTCRVAFGNRAAAEGKVMAALVKCWLANRHAKPDSREADLCRRARAELTEIGRAFIEADEDAGRPPVADYVETLLRDTLYMDRTRKF